MNIGIVLKEEIARVARKQLKADTDQLKKNSGRHRSDLADLKRRVALLEQQIRKLEKVRSHTTQDAGNNPSIPKLLRFSGAGLKKHRERLGLTATNLASILDVSPQTIYNWEAGTSRPPKDQVSKIAILRKMGKKEVQERLRAQGLMKPS